LTNTIFSSAKILQQNVALKSFENMDFQPPSAILHASLFEQTFDIRILKKIENG